VRLNKRERRMVLGAGLFLSLVAVYLFLIEPYFKSREEINERLEAALRLDREYHAILAGEDAYKELLRSRKNDMLAVSRLLLSGNTSSLAAAELSNKIRDFADEAGVSITRENVNKPESIDHHQRISIQLNMSCDIIGLKDFLAKIEGDKNLLVVSKLEINAPSAMRRSYRKGRYQRIAGTEPENLRVTITISGFIEGEGTVSGEKG